MPTPAAFGVEFAVAVVEVAELDEEDKEDKKVAVVPELFEELMTELLAELQGTDVVVAAPTAPGIAATMELVARFISPPSNVDSAGTTSVPAEQGARLTPPE